jgi:methionyl-tRNA synthetase
MSPGNDANFTEENFVLRYNCDLANDLGNLLSRVLKMTLRSTDGVIPTPGPLTADDEELNRDVAAAIDTMESSLAALKFDQGIAAVMNAVRSGNRYLERTAPWTLAKKGETERLNTVLFTAADALRQVSVLLAPVMPEKMAQLRSALGFEGDEVNANIAGLRSRKGALVGHRVRDTAGLFPRIETEKKAKEPAAKPGKAKKEAPVNVVEPIDIADFAKVELRTAKIVAAEKVEGADKLLKLQLEVGAEKRQIVSGIANWYKPEELPGKTIVIVANLKPAVIRGVESAGMLLAAKSGKELRLVTIDGEIACGAQVG